MRQAIVFTVTFAMISATLLFAQEAKKRDRNRKQQRQPFQQVFTLRGVEFSKDQQTKVGEIRKKYVPVLVELQKKLNGVYTNEQRRARQQAFRTARDAGKNAQDVRKAVAAAFKLTGDQQKQSATIQKERSDLQAKIRKEIRSLLTDKQQAQLRRQRNRNTQRRPAVPPTHPDLKYGPHRRNVLDVWLAKSDKPTPVLVSIHGGGFRGGNKSVSGGILKGCLDSGVSVVAITYRLTDEAIAPAQFLDSARAIQFIRHNAKKWNLDPTRIAATGGSAGAGISLWLGFHDNLADPDNEDPILRQSTRLTCTMVFAGQTSYDPRFIRKLFPDSDTYKHIALALLFDVDLNKLDDLPEEKYRLFEEVSPIHHLTKDDVPAMLSYGGALGQKVTNENIGIHHARFGEVLKQKMDALNIRCEVYAGNQVLGAGRRVSPIEFLKQEFGMTE